MAGGDMSTGKKYWSRWLRGIILLAAVTVCVAAQNTANQAEKSALKDSSSSNPPAANSVTDSVNELREQGPELQAAVAAMRSDWQQSLAETAELKRALDEVRAGAGLRNAVLKEAIAPGNANSAAQPQQSVVSDYQKPEVRNEVQNESKNEASSDDQKKRD